MLPAWLYGGLKAIISRIKMNTKYNCSDSLGAVTSVLLSYAINKSVLWAFFHAACGWMYVLYWLLKYSKAIDFINDYLVKS